MTENFVYPSMNKTPTSWGFLVPKDGLLRFEQRYSSLWKFHYVWREGNPLIPNGIGIVKIYVTKLSRRQYQVSIYDELEVSGRKTIGDYRRTTLRRAMMSATRSFRKWCKSYLVKAIKETRKQRWGFCDNCGHLLRKD